MAFISKSIINKNGILREPQSFIMDMASDLVNTHKYFSLTKSKNSDLNIFQAVFAFNGYPV
jgi:hypothetical protein